MNCESGHTPLNEHESCSSMVIIVAVYTKTRETPDFRSRYFWLTSCLRTWSFLRALARQLREMDKYAPSVCQHAWNRPTSTTWIFANFHIWNFLLKFVDTFRFFLVKTRRK